MKKIILIVFLMLNILSFSLEGFKDLKWGSSKEEVIKKLGKNYEIIDQGIAYSNVDFANVNLKAVSFTFINNKLVSWLGYGEYTSDTIQEMASAFIQKYGELQILENDEDFIFTRNDARGTALFTIFGKETKNYPKFLFMISYSAPDYLEKQKEFKEARLKNDL